MPERMPEQNPREEVEVVAPVGGGELDPTYARDEVEVVAPVGGGELSQAHAYDEVSVS